MDNDPKVLVIGLDAAVPDFIFGKWRSLMPNLSLLIKKGISGKLKSCFPPITVPAWMCMFTGKDPGELGIYGFRNRTSYKYDQLEIANSSSVKEKTLWEYGADDNKGSIVIGVPPTFPPKPIKGTMISCFLTPQNSKRGVYPKEVWGELMQLTDNGYLFDVYDYRKINKEALLKSIYKMTNNRFKVAKEWLRTKDWDLFILMEIGLDRLQHTFWADSDPSHYLFEENNQFINALRDYYVYLDKKIGEIIEIISRETSILIVSDHGAKTMHGGFCLNEWLIQNNYLKLKRYPLSRTNIDPEIIDWQRTIAWAEGGYYGRLFLNIKDREPKGIINPQDYDKILFDISSKLNTIKNVNGFTMDIQAYYPKQLYKTLNGIPPDLFIVFNDFSVRSIGTIGSNKLFVRENDLGADGANHDMEGIYILRSNNIYENDIPASIDVTIYDIFPTIVDLLKLSTSIQTTGKSLFKSNQIKILA